MCVWLCCLGKLGREDMNRNASQWMATALARLQAACLRLLNFLELSIDGLAICPAVCTLAPEFLC